MSYSLWSMDCSPPSFSIHGTLQARILEWVAISFSRGSSRPRDRTQVSHVAGRRFNLCTTWLNIYYQNLSKFTQIVVLLKIFFFQFYWNIVDIQHSISLRCIALLFDLHPSGSDYHNKFTEWISFHRYQIKAEKKFLGMRTLRIYS